MIMTQGQSDPENRCHRQPRDTRVNGIPKQDREKLQGDLSYKFAKVAFPFPRQPHMGKNLIMGGWGGIWLWPITLFSIFVPNIGMKHE